MNYRRNFPAMNTPNHIIIDGDAIAIQPNEAHGFLITGVELARFYKMAPVELAAVIKDNPSELSEGRHYLAAEDCLLWTARGVIRLGFLVDKPDARDLAEEICAAHHLNPIA
jgi:hypothetical protein